MATFRITQGADCTIHVRDILDGAKAPLSVTGWVVRAQARCHAGAAVLAEWRTNPTGSQGTATADSNGIHLNVPAAMSDPWTWTTAQLHVEATEPAPGTRQARPGEADLVLDRAIVHD